nr:EthD domain-containing protein [Sphingomonas sp. CDS-1]
MMILSRRRPGMTHAEFLAYNVEKHGVMVRTHPVAIRRYLQHDIYDGAFGKTGDTGCDVTVGRDNVTELYFDDMAGLVSLRTDPETRRSLNDGANYADATTAVVMIANEIEIPVQHAGSGRLKIFHFLRKNDGVAPQSFRQVWQSAHDAALERSGTVGQIRRVIWSEPAPQEPAKGKDKPAESTTIDSAMAAPQLCHGYSTIWYDRELTGPDHFRAYVDQFTALTEGSIDHAGSFFLLAREQLIFDYS